MEIFYPLLYGIGTGFMMSVMLGAIFFMLIQTGVKHGYKKAFIIASGVIVCDILFVILAISFTGLIRDFLKAERSTNTTAGLEKAKQNAKKEKQIVAEKKKADKENMIATRQMQKAQKAEKKIA